MSVRHQDLPALVAALSEDGCHNPWLEVVSGAGALHADRLECEDRTARGEVDLRARPGAAKRCDLGRLDLRMPVLRTGEEWLYKHFSAHQEAEITCFRLI